VFSTDSSQAQAIFGSSSLEVGNHSIAAIYSGDDTFTGSTSDPIDQNVVKAWTTTSFSTARMYSYLGQSVTFTVQVGWSGWLDTPTGTVSFNDGGTYLGSSPVDESGESSLTVSSLSVGDHSITAAYSGDDTFSGSTSSPLNQTIVKLSTTTSLASSQNASRLGQTITFTASVASGTFGMPTGTISFKDGDNDLGSSPIDQSGRASITTSSLTVGSHTITAVYNGDNTYDTTMSPTVSQIVDPNTTSLALSSSLPTSIKSQQVTFAASLSWTGPFLPTGESLSKTATVLWQPFPSMSWGELSSRRTV
jgi:hypothetical protein